MIKIISKDERKISFVADISETLGNAIRRSALEIPILAIDDIEIYKNDSALYDEVLAHRLGLIPLVTEKSFKERDSFDLKIQVKGPLTVLSKDLKGNAKVVYEKIPIVILNQDQELELVAKAKLGKGIEHNKYSPGLVYYRNLCKIEFDKKCDGCKECVEACPQKILEVEKGKVNVIDSYKCDLCEACVEACKQHEKNAIKIEKIPELIFFIESWGQIKPQEILIRAVSQLNSNIGELSKAIK